MQPNLQFEKTVAAILISLISSGLIGIFIMFMNMNKSMVVMEERSRAQAEVIAKMENSQNQLKIDLFDVKGNIQAMKISKETLDEARKEYKGEQVYRQNEAQYKTYEEELTAGRPKKKNRTQNNVILN